jgi:hypothetical protein
MLRKDHRLRVLKRIFGESKVTGSWRGLNNGKLYNLYSSPDDQTKEDEQGIQHV